jgi:hypothetical protein
LVFGVRAFAFGLRPSVFCLYGEGVECVWEGERCGGIWRRQVAHVDAPMLPGHSVVLACIEAEQ